MALQVVLAETTNDGRREWQVVGSDPAPKGSTPAKDSSRGRRMAGQPARGAVGGKVSPCASPGRTPARLQPGVEPLTERRREPRSREQSTPTERRCPSSLPLAKGGSSESRRPASTRQSASPARPPTPRRAAPSSIPLPGTATRRLGSPRPTCGVAGHGDAVNSNRCRASAGSPSSASPRGAARAAGVRAPREQGRHATPHATPLATECSSRGGAECSGRGGDECSDGGDGEFSGWGGAECSGKEGGQSLGRGDAEVAGRGVAEYAGSSDDGDEQDASQAATSRARPAPVKPNGLMGKLSLDLSALRRGEEGDCSREAGAAPSGTEASGGKAELQEARQRGRLQSDEVRASLKLNLSALSEAAPRAAAGERPVWEFDFAEITLGNRIGAGAFGEVYEASWRRSRIAVKRLLCQRLTEDAHSQFMGEMELMSNLRHPNIVRFLGACFEPLQMSILFELCSTSLFHLLHSSEGAPLGMEFALGIIRQTALGIFYLHQCKLPVLHLDLKSANVLLDEHGVAKVCDFGLSHIKRETAVITSRMGSPQWTAPEILRGEPHDESADTYSFGILLYEIMARELPYKGVDTFQVVMGVITKMLPRPTLPTDCVYPQQLQELMRACYAEEAAQRPRFSRILDVADEALEQLALRPQLAGSARLSTKAARKVAWVDESSESPQQQRVGGTITAEGRWQAVTLVDHVPEAVDELAFRRGEVIRDVVPVVREADEWLRGVLRGREGIFRRAHVCMSSLCLPEGDAVPHHTAPIDEEYAVAGGVLISACHGCELMLCEPRGGGERVRLAIARADTAEWRERGDARLALMEQLNGARCAHLLPLLRVLRSPCGDRVAMVMPHMRGGDLFDRLERHGPLAEPMARAVATQLLNAVSQLHARNVLHGDLHPACLLFESEDARSATLRLDVLRAARRIPSGSSSLEGGWGTPDYASPQMLSWLAEGVRPQPYGLDTDMWSIGVIVYVMLSGFAPFRGDTLAQLYKTAMSGRLGFPAVMEGSATPTAWTFISPAAKQFIERLLQVDPSARPRAEDALRDPWLSGEYDGAAVKATIVTLRERFLAWSMLHPTTVQEPGIAGEDGMQPLQLHSRATRETPRKPSSPHAERQESSPSTMQRVGGMQLSLGHLSRWVKDRLGHKRRRKVLLLGLDGAGKSRLLMSTHKASTAPTMPTVGYDVDVLEHAEVVFHIYDMGGQRHLRPHWTQSLASQSKWDQGCENIDGIIFVIDSADPARWPEAREELARLRLEPRVQSVPLLVLANKIDLPFAQNPSTVADVLHLSDDVAEDGRPVCAVRGSSAFDGTSFLTALEWILDHSRNAGS
ncbi:hypothetical protein AB1Y20_008480 [Prymnesium parvum]|uniref:mitogen-activated protein kinase kinase kinase n=1 Tax=Prymnesium parvum TaxID=97485 RepID=A0AB34ITD1_PRYPA